MLFILALILTVSAVAAIFRFRVPGGVNAATLGWMSQQWLAEYRASRRR
jgi:hypothetical protein